ncbi:hypothetical protein [Thiomonas sp.]|jgi:hypothetical protein|uniref:hypothetical protein n=1 Tax=Thiomonas sp. TaxID=2047785 RepID=UPI002625C209|nr:hypothetical protein [Thiomonas sp.]
MSAETELNPRQRLAKLRAELRQLEAAEKRRNARAHETRRRILIGAAIMHKINAGEWPRDKLLAMMDGYLTRDADRALFDLPRKAGQVKARKPANHAPQKAAAVATSSSALERPTWADGSDRMPDESEADYILRKHIEGPPQGWA